MDGNLTRAAFTMLKLILVLAVLKLSLGFPTNKSVPLLNGRIVGGEETDIAHHPYQLALLYYLQHYCGGALFHYQWGITAAHCLEGVIVSNLAVRAGSTTKSSGGEIVSVSQFYVHPNYINEGVDYDFALLQLAQPVAVQTAAPIRLPELNYPIVEGDIAVITGWGTLSETTETTPEILHAVEVPVVNQQVCQSAYGTVTPRMFCTGIIGVGGKDACRGDGGGPVEIGGHLAGIVSWGSGCADAYFPGVHSNVASVVDWVHDTSGV